MFRTLRQSARFMQRAQLTTSTRQIRGIQPALIQADQDFIHIANIPKKVYTVRPVAFWMDKILEKENKKPLDFPTTTFNDRTIEKNMSDSYVEEFLPFKSSPTLLDEYITTGGKIRIGKIFEDIDALAGSIAYKHVDTFVENSRPLTCVTASVDRMELLMPNSVEDLKLSGHVAYVGTSSMEVFVKLETIPDYNSSAVEASAFPPKDFIAEPTDNTVLFARITFVAIDSITGKSVKVNPLVARNEKEKKIFDYAQDCKSRKKLVGQSSLAKVPPTADERLTIHDIYMKYQHNTNVPENSVWMEDTKLQSVLLMQPQNRNIHNKVFGGYLMKSAYELAHATGTMFAKSPVSLLSSDEIVFKKPVPVGSLLNLSSKVIHSQENGTFQVSVTAEVTDVESRITDTTNTFHFTLAAQNDNIPKVLPKTYAESMLYLEGKRRSEDGAQAKQQLLSLKQCEN